MLWKYIIEVKYSNVYLENNNVIMIKIKYYK